MASCSTRTAVERRYGTQALTDGKLFIVLPIKDVDRVEALAWGLTVPSRRGELVVVGDSGAAKASSSDRARATGQLIAHLSSFPPHPRNRLFLGRETKCSFEDLIDWWRGEGFGHATTKTLAPAAVRRELTEHLRSTGAHWRDHAVAELGRFEGYRGNLDAWLQQFAELKHGGIGQKLAARLRVVRTGELPGGAFAMREADQVGLRRLACYIEDDDQGGSWLEMKGLLERTFPPGTVHPVRWREDAGTLDFPSVPADEIVIHEDGLWSGHEAVKRLRAIGAQPPASPVTLRYGIVTDFGLLVARQAIRSFGLEGRVSIDTSRAELLAFLATEVPEEMRLGLGVDPANYYTALHNHVEGYAFRPSEDWSSEEIAACADIGRQLVREWLRRDNGSALDEAKASRFALGGGGFASTVAFSRSVPKVCLPLLWLGGQVTLGARTIAWRPLLVDSRRVSGADLLHAGSI